MLYIVNPHTDAYFNAALEQYLLHHFNDNIFMLWRNENAVVLGKHQVAYKEVNYPYVTDNQVQVARRITGGGTVYHDLGNINFTFIERIENREKLIDFKRYLVPMKEALGSIGVDVEITTTNDLVIGDRKISGNAAHVFSQQKKVIHHGTILFNSDLKNLGVAIRPGKAKFDTKAVNSNRTTVTNVSENSGHADIQTFIELLKDEILRDKPYSDYHLTAADEAHVKGLVEDKFETWQWNYGYSPQYNMICHEPFEVEGLKISFRVKNGEVILVEASLGDESIDLDCILGLEHNIWSFKNTSTEISNCLNISKHVVESKLMDLFH